MRGKETIFEKLVSFPRAPLFPKNFQKAEGDFFVYKAAAPNDAAVLTYRYFGLLQVYVICLSKTKQLLLFGIEFLLGDNTLVEKFFVLFQFVNILILGSGCYFYFNACTFRYRCIFSFLDEINNRFDYTYHQ